jgi:hypothetical protein
MFRERCTHFNRCEVVDLAENICHREGDQTILWSFGSGSAEDGVRLTAARLPVREDRAVKAVVKHFCNLNAASACVSARASACQ